MSLRPQIGRRKAIKQSVETKPFTRRVRTLLFTLVLASLVVRMINILSPLVEAYSFRQTQTAITIWAFVTDGISLFDYQTPIFGPPWKVPFEFPVFQATAASLVYAGIENIDMAGRLTNIFYFYLSAFFLFLLCRSRFEDRTVSWAILLFYLWVPYNILWSRTCMIDFASVAFALAYMHMFLRALEGGRLAWWAGAMVAGCLGYLVKITTMPVVVLPLAYYVIRHIVANARMPGSLSPSGFWPFLVRLAPSALISGVPVLAGLAWNAYADHVKAASPYTDWLVSTNPVIVRQVYGSLLDKLSLDRWSEIIGGVHQALLPGFAMVLPVVGLWRAYKCADRQREFVYAISIGAVLTVLLFFNLYYAHRYYLIAISPVICITSGLGLHSLFFSESYSRKWIPATVFILLALSYACTWNYLLKPYILDYKRDNSYCLGMRAAMVTPPNEYVIVANKDFSSDVLYYAKRRGVMLRMEEWDSPSQFYRDHPFSTFLCWGGSEHPILGSWDYVQEFMSVGPWKIYKVGPLGKKFVTEFKAGLQRVDDPALRKQYEHLFDSRK